MEDMFKKVASCYLKDDEFAEFDIMVKELNWEPTEMWILGQKYL